MRFAFTDDQRAFADGLADLLSGECPPSLVRAAWEDGSGHSPELWARLGDLGLFSLLVPVDAGGMGGGMVDAVLLFEQLGAAAVPGPVIEQMVAAPLLAGTDHGPGVLAGTTVVTAATSLDGPVPHAAVADLVVVDGALAVGGSRSGVSSLDGGRRLAVVSGATTTPLATGDLADRMALAVAAQLVGVASSMVALAADYARQRHQFGKPIGTFQAVKHHLADALGAVEFGRAPVAQAAWSLDEGLPTAPADVSLARVLATTGAEQAARSALQVHGAIGYTWECDLHLWMKKVWALQAAWGDTSSHRRRVGQWLLTGDRPVTPDGVTMPSFDRLS